ncbi:MAG: SPASM domain-containing protein, partial [Acidimicrobiales bacterium]|nr:SPASM domain-containing protein [Acidimicrobiales bacterium]
MRRVFVRSHGAKRDSPVPEETAAAARAEVACHAPFGNLFLDPLGEARACCVAAGYPLGDLSEQRLPEIWSAPRTVALRQAMVDRDFSMGCGHCDWRLGAGLPSVHHAYDALPADSLTPPSPRRLEINISNSCNLQCVMCNGDYSSAIRLHREGRPALPKVYGESFFSDLEAIIPNLQEVSFTGGEPFLVPEYYRI